MTQKQAKIVIINLSQSSDRRNAILEHLAELNLHGDIFPAVDGRQLLDSEIATIYDAEKARNSEWGELTRGEIGCALSHRGVWQALVDSDDAGWLVLEDDALLAADTSEWLSDLPHYLINGDVVPFVFTSPTPYYFHRKKLGKRWLVYPNQAFVSAIAYYITPLAAQRLLAASLPLWFPIDAWYSTPGFKGVTPIRAIWPAAVIPRDQHINASTIGVRHAHTQKNQKNQTVHKNPVRVLLSRIRRYLKNRFFIRPVRFY